MRHCQNSDDEHLFQRLPLHRSLSRLYRRAHRSSAHSLSRKRRIGRTAGSEDCHWRTAVLSVDIVCGTVECAFTLMEGV